MILTNCHVCGRRRMRGGRIVTLLDPVDRALGVRVVCRGCGTRVVNAERRAS